MCFPCNFVTLYIAAVFQERSTIAEKIVGIKSARRKLQRTFLNDGSALQSTERIRSEHRKGPEQSTVKDQVRAGKDQRRVQERTKAEQSTGKDHSRAQERIRSEHRKGPQQSIGKDQSRAQVSTTEHRRIGSECRKEPQQSTGKHHRAQENRVRVQERTTAEHR